MLALPLSLEHHVVYALFARNDGFQSCVEVPTYNVKPDESQKARSFP